jgi:hypothetical protein
MPLSSATRGETFAGKLAPNEGLERAGGALGTASGAQIFSAERDADISEAANVSFERRFTSQERMVSSRGEATDAPRARGALSP